MKMTITLCLWMVMLTVSRAAVIDHQSRGLNEQSVQMETTIDDLMNALAQVTKSKGM
jgi:hypothetical protein